VLVGLMYFRMFRSYESPISRKDRKMKRRTVLQNLAGSFGLLLLGGNIASSKNGRISKDSCSSSTPESFDYLATETMLYPIAEVGVEGIWFETPEGKHLALLKRCELDHLANVCWSA